MQHEVGRRPAGGAKGKLKCGLLRAACDRLLVAAGLLVVPQACLRLEGREDFLRHYTSNHSPICLNTSVVSMTLQGSQKSDFLVEA